MVKLSTTVEIQRSAVTLSLRDKVVVLGSCFADGMGAKLVQAGFDILVNPFGTLYNPASIAKAVERLDSGEPFTREDCVEMGAGAGLICSFHHHTSFARPTAEEFLENANAHLSEASAFWKNANKVIINYDSAAVWTHESSGSYNTGSNNASNNGSAQLQAIVSNCLKRPAKEFGRRTLSVEECSELTKNIINGHPEKQFILTVSPIRHINPDGVHASTISKATLHLAIDSAIHAENGASVSADTTASTTYFPSYEILLDELRDYRFYTEDLLHPSSVAENIIWERFVEAMCLPYEVEEIRANEKNWRSSQHIDNGRRWKKD